MAYQNIRVFRLVGLMGLFWLSAACQPPSALTDAPAPSPTVTRAPSVPTPTPPFGLTEDQAVALNSLEQIADYPLYTMHLAGAYSTLAFAQWPEVTPQAHSRSSAYPLHWGCSLFATLGEPGQRLYGRNFDWSFSPALLLFTDPPDGYASVSMVDIEYLGYTGDRAKHLTSYPLDERRPLLEATELPFDGMNEKGLAVGMAAVSPGQMKSDPTKRTVDELLIIRELLDHAATVEEAVNLLGRYNIDMSEVPIHYLIASVSGQAALVEFYAGERRVLWNEQPWHLATNFLLAATNGAPEGQCSRYDRLTQRLTQAEGRLAGPEAMELLAKVSQANTQWSVVYDMSTGEVNIVMGRDFTRSAHTLRLEMSEP